ncbi:MAG: pimeloyl-ACP methyl ester carboxylesterase [Akkermansiaceae bacterium]|jgi:pimeloyl-ACP methyl ester carboxylesterase
MKSSKPYRIPGLELIDHTFEVPLDHSEPEGRKLEVFVREVCDLDPKSKEKPFLVFLQGGPGFRAPLPIRKEGWLKRALTEFRVLMYDTRGNGLSSPVDYQTLALEGDAQAQADYLKHFRQDDIVRDAELVRAKMSPETPWSTIGQSYGGWCTMTYLSLHPEGLKECFVFGGLPGLDRTAREIYEGTFPFVEGRNREYFEKFPMDKARLTKLAKHLEENDVRFSNGDRVIPQMVQLLGLKFGFAHTAEEIHFLLEEAFVKTGDKEVVSHTFKVGLQAALRFDTNPIFAILHEAIYAQGGATGWACEAVQKELYPQFDNFDDFLFYGEMVFPWMFDEISELKGMKDAAEILAAKDDWPVLYDKEVLSRNTVPVACAVYANDMFVNVKFSRETVDFVPNMKAWVTSEFEHCGLRVGGENIFSRLIDLARGEVER